MKILFSNNNNNLGLCFGEKKQNTTDTTICQEILSGDFCSESICITPSLSKTPTQTPTPTITQTLTPTPTITTSITPTQSTTPTITPTITRSATPTPTPTPNPFSISWNTSYSGTLNGNPWIISNNNKKIRYNVEDSGDCGGSNNNIQTGLAIATINTGNANVNMEIDFDGLGEAQASEFELIRFYLDNNLIGSANAPGGGLGCVMGTVVKNPPNIPTIVLSPNTQYEFKIDFTTNDALFHVGAFYEVNLVFN